MVGFSEVLRHLAGQTYLALLCGHGAHAPVSVSGHLRLRGASLDSTASAVKAHTTGIVAAAATKLPVLTMVVAHLNRAVVHDDRTVDVSVVVNDGRVHI